MSLTALWLKNRELIQGKTVEQVIKFAGDGRLLDGSSASSEFREFLTYVPVDALKAYAEYCLNDKFADSGLVLQDIVNEIGQRLGFQIQFGRYRGVKQENGFDGLWRIPNRDHAIIVEVKTTDTFNFDLDRIVDYRARLVGEGHVSRTASSILIVVGRNNTGSLETQIRGSKHAWDMRLISIQALVHLLELKETVENKTVFQKMFDILVPQEFTKLDGLIEILFETAEEIKYTEEVKYIEPDETLEVNAEPLTEKDTPVTFTEACVARIEMYLQTTLVKRGRVLFSSPNDELGLACIISKEYTRSGGIQYWFAFHPSQNEFLSFYPNAYVALGCGSPDKILLLPLRDLANWLPDLSRTEKEDRFYWHVYLLQIGERIFLHRKAGVPPVDITQYLIK